MKLVSGLQRDCLEVIGDLGNPLGATLYTELVDRYGFKGNDGRIHFALLNLIEEGLVERHQQNKLRYWYSLTAQGEREWNRL